MDSFLSQICDLLIPQKNNADNCNIIILLHLTDRHWHRGGGAAAPPPLFGVGKICVKFAYKKEKSEL